MYINNIYINKLQPIPNVELPHATKRNVSRTLAQNLFTGAKVFQLGNLAPLYFVASLEISEAMRSG